MDELKIYKIFKIWFISLTSFDFILIAFIYILGNYTEQDFPTYLANITTVIAVISGLVGITSIIYAIVKKQSNQILIGLGILFFALVLLLFSVILAIATIF